MLYDGIDFTSWQASYFNQILAAQQAANSAIESAQNSTDLSKALNDGQSALTLLQQRINGVIQVNESIQRASVNYYEKMSGIQSNRDRDYDIALYNLAIQKIQSATTNDEINQIQSATDNAMQMVYSLGASGLSGAVASSSSWIDLSKLSDGEKAAFHSGIEQVASDPYIPNDDIEDFYNNRMAYQSKLESIENNATNLIAKASINAVLNYIAQQAENKTADGKVANKAAIEALLTEFENQVNTAISNNPDNMTVQGINFNKLISDARTQFNAIPLIDAPVTPASSTASNQSASTPSTKEAALPTTGGNDENTTAAKTDSKNKNTLPKTAEQFVRDFNPVAVLAIVGVGISLLAFRNKKQQH